MAAAQGKVRANPTKHFFVRMLTRDIALEDCVFDLIDNSVDQAWRSVGHVPSSITMDELLSDYYVNLVIQEDRFEISDNCGGMTLTDAVNYAFTFGRSEEREPDGYTVGVYGIGMKRAVFKLGEEILIRSTPAAGGEDPTPFKVPINVPEWLADRSAAWDFDLLDDTPLENAGLSITVTNLLPETSEQFALPEFQRQLRRTIARDYMVPLMRGLRIEVNGEPVSPLRLSFVNDVGFEPLRSSYSDGPVSVEVMAGVLASEVGDDDDSVDSRRRSAARSGWYVICNGRVILGADTSAATGWGVELPRWHIQYNGFIGLVFFTSPDPELLPMTTTKRDVDLSSSLYRRALVNHMVPPARAWVQYTNDSKKQESPVSLAQASTVELSRLEPRSAMVLPSAPKVRNKIANVNYAVPLSEMKQLQLAWDGVGMTYREVGLRSFRFAFDEHVDQES